MLYREELAPIIDWKIEKPTLLDVPKLIELYSFQLAYHKVELDEDYYISVSPHSMGKFRRHVEQAIQKDDTNSKDGSNILVARRNGKIAGFLTYVRGHDDNFSTDKTEYGEVEELFVSGEDREAGIGNGLLQKAEEDIAKQGLKYMKLKVAVKNNKARDFYEKKGYIRDKFELRKDISTDKTSEVTLISNLNFEKSKRENIQRLLNLWRETTGKASLLSDDNFRELMTTAIETGEVVIAKQADGISPVL